MDPETGKLTQGFDTYSMEAVMQPLRAGEIQVSAGLYQLGDQKFYVRTTDMNFTVRRTGRFTYRSVPYNIVNYYRGSHRRIWAIIGRTSIELGGVEIENFIDDDLGAIFDKLGFPLCYDEETAPVVFDSETGELTQDFDTHCVCAVIQPLKVGEIQVSSGLYQLGDQKFYARVADMDFVVRRTGRFTYRSVRYNVVNYYRGSHRKIWAIIGRTADA